MELGTENRAGEIARGIFVPNSLFSVLAFIISFDAWYNRSSRSQFGTGAEWGAFLRMAGSVKLIAWKRKTIRLRSQSQGRKLQKPWLS
jgi:hypothetical protein